MNARQSNQGACFIDQPLIELGWVSCTSEGARFVEQVNVTMEIPLELCSIRSTRKKDGDSGLTRYVVDGGDHNAALWGGAVC
ncbi:hypothetical protein CBR_g23660 [Chara braunii]|uniref:Uncharacterized protein n=1 Tax=Chara braunii TaxID=69332 RepID=A0A388L4S8_CHABU|nr:hypothetical protein CBR_g23660 [Chara braunii]|eukprot:GBG77329.1 hypothetical protein CBR_g23660 [Chara braunii]